jgi:hypothetical protein
LIEKVSQVMADVYNYFLIIDHNEEKQVAVHLIESIKEIIK